MRRIITIILGALMLLTSFIPLVSAQVQQVQTYFIDAVQGMWYAVNTGGQPYRVFYYDAAGNTVYVTAYRWDANQNYIIFQAPCSCRIFLRQESYSLSTLDTKSWFANTPLTFTVNLTTSWFVNYVISQRIPYNLSRTLTYNGTHVVVADTYIFNTSSPVALDYVYSYAPVEAGRAYTASVTVSPSIQISIVAVNVFIKYYLTATTPSYIFSAVFNDFTANRGFYYFPATITVNGTNVILQLSSDRAVFDQSVISATGVINVKVVPAQPTYTNTYSYPKDSSGVITARNGYRISIYDSISELPTKDVIQKSSTFVYYLYTQDIQIVFSPSAAQSVNAIVVPINTLNISQTLKSPVPAVYLSDVSIWAPAWLVNYGSNESFLVFIPPLPPSGSSLRASIVYNYPVRYASPQLEYTYATLENTLSLFAVNGTVSKTFNVPQAVIYEGTIYLGSHLGSTILFRIDPLNTRNLTFQGVEYGWINTSSSQYLVVYVYSPSAYISGSLAIFSALILENVHAMMEYSVTVSNVSLSQWPMTLISYVVTGNIIGSWSYRIPIYISLSELPAHISESGFVFRLELPLQDWIRAGLLSPGLEDLMFTDAASQPLLFYIYDASRGIVYVRYNAPIVTQAIVIYVLLKNPSLWGSGRTFSTLQTFDMINPRDFVDDFGFSVYTTYLSYNALLVVTQRDTSVKFGKTWYDFVWFDSSALYEQHGSLIPYAQNLSSSFTDGDELLIYINRQDYDNVLVYKGSTPLFSFRLSDFNASPSYYVGYRNARAVYAFRMLMYSYSVGQLVGGYPQPQQIQKTTPQIQNVQIDWWTLFMSIFAVIALSLAVKWISEGGSRPAPQKPFNLP